MKARISIGRSLLPAVIGLLASGLAAQTVERVSVDVAGADSNGASLEPSLSQDGRFVAFASAATDLVASDANGSVRDVFVRDRSSATTELVNRDNTGQQGAAEARSPSISADGRFVAFLSNALVAPDPGWWSDVYRRDRATGTTVLVSPVSFTVSYTSCAISGNGQVVAFFGKDPLTFDTQVAVRDLQSGQTHTWASNSVPTPTTDFYSSVVLARGGRYVAFFHVFGDGSGGGTTTIDRFDLAMGSTLALLGGQSVLPRALSADGQKLLYGSAFGNEPDVYSLDIASGATQRVTRTTNATAPNAVVSDVALSDDGRYTLFSSAASNIVAGDINGKSDVFLHDRVSDATVQVSLSASGQPGDGDCSGVDLVGDASLAVFDSAASNLVAGDGNGLADVFTRTSCFAHYTDSDADGYGAAGTGQLVCLPVASLSLSDRDCDDTNAAVHPGAPETCNGIDDDCNGVLDDGPASTAYCTTSLTSHSCAPQIGVSGNASASATSGLVVSVTEVEGQKNGIVYYGLAPLAVPWGSSSWQCVAPPRQRTTAMQSGGTANVCDGVLSIDVLAWISAHPGALGTPLQAGQALYFQGWFRDPPAPQHSNLSGGWTVTLCP